MNKLLILAAGGVGYVLGSKAGRQRYDQMKSAYDKVKSDPRVQEKTQQATDLAKDAITGAASAATDKVKAAATGGGDSTDELNPDRLKLTDDTGPKGDLP